jgi:hypothetical protein
MGDGTLNTLFSSVTDDGTANRQWVSSGAISQTIDLSLEDYRIIVTASAADTNVDGVAMIEITYETPDKNKLAVYYSYQLFDYLYSTGIPV